MGERDDIGFEAAHRWLRWWLYGLNGVLLACAVALALEMGSRFAILLTVLVPAAFVPFAYARLRLQRSLLRALRRRGAQRWMAYGSTALSCLADGIMAAQLLTARSTTGMPMLQIPSMAWIGPVWFSTYALLFLGYALVGLGRFAGRLTRRLLPARETAITPLAGTLEPVVGRRQLLQQFGVIGAGAPFIVSLSSIQLSYAFRVEAREITLPHWPTELDGLRVAHLSDIHVGGAMNRERLLHVAALTNAARPDLVLHTGDFLTHRSGSFDAPLYEALARIRTPYGQWASLGNHDFDDVPRLVQGLNDAGVSVLRNRLISFDVNGHPLEIGGVDFLFRPANRSAEYARILGAWRPRDGAARLLLNHDPSAFQAVPDSCADLVLSGHMHGGQIGIQLDSSHALTLVGLFGIPDQGIYRRGDMRLYVTRCVGFYGYPMRIGIPPEIALLTLRSPRPEAVDPAAAQT